MLHKITAHLSSDRVCLRGVMRRRNKILYIIYIIRYSALSISLVIYLLYLFVSCLQTILHALFLVLQNQSLVCGLILFISSAVFASPTLTYHTIETFPLKITLVLGYLLACVVKVLR